MTKFAGIEFAELDIRNMTFTDLQLMQMALVENCQHSGFEPIGFGLPEKVIVHLENHFKIRMTPVRTDQQRMAIAIKFLPDATQAKEPTRDDDVIKIVRDVLQTEHCKQRSLEELYAIIDKHKQELDFMYDWHDTVDELYDSVSRTNLVVAFKNLRLIKSLVANKSTTTHSLSLQIIYYIAIMDYLQRHLDDPDAVRFDQMLRNEIYFTASDLTFMLENEVKPKKAASSLYFCLGRKARNDHNSMPADLAKLRADL